MTRAALVILLAVPACGQATDDRPRTLEYITRTVLQPACGSAPCHSAFAQDARRPPPWTDHSLPQPQAIPLVFDTVEGFRGSLKRDSELLDHFRPGEDDVTPTLIVNLTVEKADPIAPRMPFDAPLPDADIALIHDWILLGGPGVCSPTDVVNGYVCHGKTKFACTEDRAYGAVMGECQ